MAPPRHFGSACEVESFAPGIPVSGLTARDANLGPGFRWTLLQRHGRRPLALLGRTLLQANNRCTGLSCWSEIAVYETAASRFAASLRHEGREIDGPISCDAWLCDSSEAVRAAFFGHDPVVGWQACRQPHFDGKTMLMPGSPADIDMFCDVMARDAAATLRFRGAWAGLLAAVFGLPVAHRVTV